MPKKTSSSNIIVAFVATAITALLLFFLIILIGVGQRKYAYDDSKRLASEVSRKAVLETEIYFSNALAVARTLKEKSLILKEAKAERSIMTRILKESLNKNPNFLAVWTMWEHDAYDGKDNSYRGEADYDSVGNLSTTYFKYNDTILVEETEPDDYFEDYYTIPKSTRAELIIEPYNYKYEGFPYVFYEISVVVPIFVDSTFAGVFGVDISLEALQSKLNRTKLYSTGYLSLISPSGIIVSHADTSIVRRNILEFIPATDTLTYNTIAFGKELEVETVSEFSGKKVIRYFYPISGSGSAKPWSMMVEIPIEEVTIRSRQLFYVAGGIMVLGISLLVYLVHNIVVQRKYERSLLAAKQRAEESDALKTIFLHNISHEIRTPLNGILGFSELIAAGNTTSEQNHNYSRIIRNSSNQLLATITNVLNISKIQSGQILVILTEVEIAKQLNLAVKSQIDMAIAKGIELIVSIPVTLENIYLLSDESKLQHIMSNLISNAIKFTEEGFVEVGLQESESDLVIYVRDTGIGIAKEQLSRIFGCFSQADDTISQRFGGTGVGLAISKAYVEALGGKIWFESEFGKGSTFSFSLPKTAL